MQPCNRSAAGCSLLLLSLQLAAAATSGASSLRTAGQPAEFRVYWNVPTFMCRKHQLDFSTAAQRFGILQNRADEFAGDRIAILYDPGAFPALLRAGEAADALLLVRNGGVPQEGRLEAHLRRFGEQLERLVPQANFSGLGVIDMESWRPIFRQNWASLQIYRNYSLELERLRQPAWWPAARLRQEAQRRFEGAARDFMRATLRLAERLRPRARWGYYAYPYCFNWSPGQQTERCAPQVERENDRMSWLFETASVLYPSVYLQLHKLSAEQRVGMVRGRVQEALRLAGPSGAKVFAYYWFKYQDQRDSYVQTRDIVDTVTEIGKWGADGLVLWGSSSDLDSKAKCEAFASYLEGSLGPALERARRRIGASRATIG